jgi:hypothetical protein
VCGCVSHRGDVGVVTDRMSSWLILCCSMMCFVMFAHSARINLCNVFLFDVANLLSALTAASSSAGSDASDASPSDHEEDAMAARGWTLCLSQRPTEHRATEQSGEVRPRPGAMTDGWMRHKGQPAAGAQSQLRAQCDGLQSASASPLFACVAVCLCR